MSNQLEDIGFLDSHQRDLDDNKYYIYEVVGGEDWDSDDNNVLDANYTKNLGAVRAIARGEDIKKAKSRFRITLVSELIYEHVAAALKYDYNETRLTAQLNQAVTMIMHGSMKDALTFDMTRNTSMLMPVYRMHWRMLIEQVHAGHYPMMFLNQTLGAYHESKQAYNMAIDDENEIMFVADGDNGVVILDIGRDHGDPAQKSLISKINISHAVDVALGENHRLYVANDANNSLDLIDISDPALPKKITEISLTGSPTGLRISEKKDHIYVTLGDAGMSVFGIDDTTDIPKLGHYDAHATVQNITLTPNGEKAILSCKQDGIQIVDIQDDASIKPLGYFDTKGSAWDTAVSTDGTLVFIADRGNGVVVVDIADPHTPVFSEHVALTGNANRLFLSEDDRLYVADGSAGMVVLDRAEENLSERQRQDTKGTAQAILLSGNHSKAYIADKENGIVVLDLHHASVWPSIGSLKTSGRAKSVTLFKNKHRAYISNGDQGVFVMDTTQPAHLKKIQSLSLSGTTWNVALNPNKTEAIIAQGCAGLTVARVDQNGSLEPIGHLAVDGEYVALSLGKHEKEIYAADYNFTVAYIDISDPTAPALRSSYRFSSHPLHVVYSSSNDKLYVVLGKGGIEVLDVHRPDNMISVGHYDTNASVQSIALAPDGQYAFLALGDDGMEIVDIHESAHIRPVHRMPIPGYAQSVFFDPGTSRLFFVTRGAKIGSAKSC